MEGPERMSIVVSLHLTDVGSRTVKKNKATTNKFSKRYNNAYVQCRYSNTIMHTCIQLYNYVHVSWRRTADVCTCIWNDLDRSHLWLYILSTHVDECLFCIDHLL